jgi:uncharacterized membrane protein YcaP (DUF421 family)
MLDHLLRIDWHGLAVPTHSVLEMIVRGTLVYLILFVLLRVSPRRQTGGVAISDLLLVVLIADASQNAMAHEYKSVTEGAVLVGTLIFWDYAFDWLTYHSPALRRLAEPAPLVLISDGRLHRRNMRQELITREELLSQLREQGVSDPREVAQAYMEPDGQISVVKRKDGGRNAS